MVSGLFFFLTDLTVVLSAKIDLTPFLLLIHLHRREATPPGSVAHIGGKHGNFFSQLKLTPPGSVSNNTKYIRIEIISKSQSIKN